MLNEDIYDIMPFFALTHHIYKNRLNYAMKNPILVESGYLIQIYRNDSLSQDDLAKLFGQSKGTIAKHLKILEDDGYIIREVDANNRRKYILKTTKKGEKLAIFLIDELKEWNDKVGISDLDDETISKIRHVARKSSEILEGD